MLKNLKLSIITTKKDAPLHPLFFRLTDIFSLIYFSFHTSSLKHFYSLMWRKFLKEVNNNYSVPIKTVPFNHASKNLSKLL